MTAGQADDPGWLDSLWENVTRKMTYGLERARQHDFIPYTTQDGEWKPGFRGTHWWTNGFWAGSMWRMYVATGDRRFMVEAERAESLLDQALALSEGLHHDVGFMWMLSAGVNYRLHGNAQSRERMVKAANFLMSRYNPNGFLRAWNGDMAGWAIIDCMMNIPLLYWAGRHYDDPRFGLVAIRHADTTLRHFLREDGSVHHIVAFDPLSGEVVDTPRGQGYAPGTSWSRGQAWAIYGFLLSYLHTGEARFLGVAKQVAHYFIANTWGDWIPNCDFRAPQEPVIKDACAGMIAVCALLTLSRSVTEHEREAYRRPAVEMLKALAANCTDFSEKSPAIVTHCTVAYHNEAHHINMTYADYFLIEALQMLRDPAYVSFWQ